jgi:ketosteroid isomerase-like protein
MFGLLLPPSRAHAQSATEKALYRLEDEFAAAVVKRDPKTLQRLTSPRWVYSDESGVMERDAGIKTFTSGPDTVREASNEKMRALVYGKTAVVIGILRLKGRGPKGPFDNRYRYTDTWMEIDGRWQCIAAQDYLMPAGKR